MTLTMATLEKYSLQFYEILNRTVGLIRTRFDERGMRAHIDLKQAIFAASFGQCTEYNVEQLRDYYGSDFDYDVLKTELEMISNVSYPITNIGQFTFYVKPGSSLFPQLYHVARLLLIMPGSNAVSERSFSAVNRVKMAYRSTMEQSRLNSLLLLHVHTSLTDAIEVDGVIDIFVSAHPRRAYYINAK